MKKIEDKHIWEMKIILLASDSTKQTNLPFIFNSGDVEGENKQNK